MHKNRGNISQINGKIKLEFIRQALREDKILSIALQGTCMRPFLKEGDSLEIRKAIQEDLRIGDIIAFHNRNLNDDIILHRLIKKRKGFIISKGDSAFKVDPPLIYSEVLGKVISIRRNCKEIPLTSFSLFFGMLASRLRLFWFLYILNKILINPRILLIKFFRLAHVASE